MSLHHRASDQNPLEHAAPKLDLMFITQTGPTTNRETKSKIRKHVMKDIGKARRKDGEQKVPRRFTLPVSADLRASREVLDLVHQPDQPSVLGENGPPLNEDRLLDFGLDSSQDVEQPVIQPQETSLLPVSSPSIGRLWAGRGDPFLKYPIEMDPNSLQLMDHIFDNRFWHTPPYRDAWLPVGLIDAAPFHQILSNASLHLESLKVNGPVFYTREALTHHMKAVRLVNRQISNSSTALSDSIIAAIAAFACHAHGVGNQAEWRMHMNAAKEVVRLRGGIENLDRNGLLWKILFWVDIGGSCTADSRPTFPVPTKVLCGAAPLDRSILQSPLVSQLTRDWVEAFPQHSEIMNIMNDMRSFVSYLGAEVTRTRGVVYSSGEIAISNILPIQHRLLSLVSPSTDDAQQKLDILRLGCILFFADIRRLFGILRVACFVKIVKLRPLLEQQKDGWGSFAILRAWVLAMAAIESSGAEQEWFFAELKKSKADLGICTWEDMEDKFREILWYDIVHTRRFAAVCDGIDSGTQVTRKIVAGRFIEDCPRFWNLAT